MCTAIIPHSVYGPVRCGQCMECRLAYSREWAIRIDHERMMHDRSCFLTLTYNDENLPRFGQLLKRDLQLFFKRLRKAGHSFRYVATGEYGELKRRPHFHMALFGVDFVHDRIPYGSGIDGSSLFVSPSLARIWGKGSFPMGHSIGTLTFESAAYIGRYICKKISGPGASLLPLACDPDTGELIMPNPEFLIASKGYTSKYGGRIGGAIGHSWFNYFFMSDAFHRAAIVTSQGTMAPVPRYYKRLLKEVGTDLAFDMSVRSSMRMKDYSESHVSRRLARSEFLRSKTTLFKRDIKGEF